MWLSQVYWFAHVAKSMPWSPPAVVPRWQSGMTCVVDMQAFTAHEEID